MVIIYDVIQKYTMVVPLCDSFVHLSDCTYTYHIVVHGKEESRVISLLSSSNYYFYYFSYLYHTGYYRTPQ